MSMEIIYLRRFRKQLKKLQKHEKLAVADAIILFGKDPFHASLKNHPLKGGMKGQRSMSAGFDLRIIFEEHEGYTVVVMIAVGSHEEVY